MRQEKSWHEFSTKLTKSSALLLSLLLIVGVTVSGTIAFLFDSDGPLKNIFTPTLITTTVVEKLENKTKSDVQIKNTGTTDAWIRAYIVVTWQDEFGNVYGNVPVLGTDYSLNLNLSADGWLQGDDGFYYWTKPVQPGITTGVLIESCTPKGDSDGKLEIPAAEEGEEPKEYFLTVEVIGSGIQSRPASVFNGNWSSGSGLCVSEGGQSLEIAPEGGAGE